MCMNKSIGLYIILLQLLLIVALLFLSRGSVRLPTEFMVPCQDPIRNAVFYDSSPKRFEEIVEMNHSWINVKTIEHNGISWPPVLAVCASHGDVVKVNILLKHGADATESLAWLDEQNNYNAVGLIQDVMENIRKTQGTAPEELRGQTP